MSKITIKARFGTVPNALLVDSNVSLKAKGLYAYIQSKPDDWDFSGERICYETSDGRAAIYSGLQELENARYLERIKSKNDLGQWVVDYVLHEKPIVENQQQPVVDFPQSDFPQPENRQRNKKGDTKKEIQKNNLVIMDMPEFPKLALKLQEFAQYRKEIKHPIKPASIASFIRKLEKASGGNEEIAVEILDTSIANGWQGIFPLKNREIGNGNFTSFSKKQGVARA